VYAWKESFSLREIEVLRLIADGLTNREISQKLHLSTETVKWYNKQIFPKLGVSNRTHAVKKAVELELLDPDKSSPSAVKPRLLSNLPAQLTSYIGRKVEIADTKELLMKHRLVVLTGPGGTGKTRLATQVAGDLVGNYRDGVWLVELASISDPAQVLNAIANVLSVSESNKVSLANVLKHYLGNKHLLLLIDNFEHLLDAASLVGNLLADAPGVAVLATSRERLHLYGEQEYPVLPLDLPDVQRPESSEQLLNYDAIKLFIDRAKAAKPGFLLNEDQIPAVVRICELLDGLPLAIELSAPLVKIFLPSVIAERLEESLDALPSGPRDIPARQRTLRATLDWSYNLLQEDEKDLFARLAVFNGGGILDAVEYISAGQSSRNVLDTLNSLVHRNLIIPREGCDGEMYFTMLETIRELNKERLCDGGKEEAVCRLHAEYYTDLAELASMEYCSPKHKYWFARLQAEQDNLRSAFAWSTGDNGAHMSLRLAAALRDYWYYYGFAKEGLRWADLALEHADQPPPALRAAALNAAGENYKKIGDLQRAKDFLSEALQIYRQLGDERNAAWSLAFLCTANTGSADEIHLGFGMAQESLAIFRKLNDLGGMTRVYNNLGELARMSEEYDTAKCYYEKCLELTKATGERLREAIQYANLGVVAYHKSDYQLAERLTKRGLSIFLEMNANYGLIYHIGALAGPALGIGQPVRAARLLGASNSGLEILGTGYQPADKPEIKLFFDEAHQVLDKKVFLEAWQEGQRMTIQEAADYALSDSGSDDLPDK
jgi:non-specific serine/threonine protein kinase